MPAFLVAGCHTTYDGRPNTNPLGTKSNYRSTDNSAVSTVNTQARDIETIASQMAASMLRHPAVGGAAAPPRIILDSKYITNASGETVDVGMIADALRTRVLRAANGRLILVSERNLAAVNEARTKKREGGYDSGSLGMSRNRLAADYRLTGRITDLRQANQGGGVSNYVRYNFELLDLETGGILWGDEYTFLKEGQNSILYR
ncbi:MAG: hypothetical protein AAF797_00850 [Planctomycetota bacterium]